MPKSKKLESGFLEPASEPFYRRFSPTVLTIGAVASLIVQALYLRDPEVLRHIPVVYDSARHFAISEALAIGGVAVVGAASRHVPRCLRTVVGETGVAMAITVAANSFHELVVDANDPSLADVTSPTVVTGAIFGAAALTLAVRNIWQQEREASPVPVVMKEAGISAYEAF
ncbi:MAG: hypothetical protein ABI220_04770 [Candidatus Saccharimonadales bacterium]